MAIRTTVSATLLAACAAGAMHAAAAQTILQTPRTVTTPDYLTLGVSGEHSDNIARVPTDPQSAWVIGAVTDFHWAAQGHPRFSADLIGTGAYYHYQNGVFDPEFMGNVNANFSLALVPERLKLVVIDSLAQARVNELSPLAPSNVQNVNRLTAGPELELHPGGAQNLLLAEALYDRTDYQDSPLDSNTIRGRVSIGRLLDRYNTVSFTAAARKVSSSGGQQFPDYAGQDYFLSWAATGVRTTLVLDAGYSTTQASGSNRVNSPLLRFNLARQISARSSAFIYASRAQVSATDAIFLDSSFSGRDSSASSYAITSDPSKLDFVGGGYMLNGTKLQLMLRGSLGRERYAVSTLDDRNERRLDGDIAYRANSWLGVGAFAEYRWETFVQRNDAHADDRYYGVFVGFALTPRLSLNVSGIRSERSADLGPGSFDETSARAILTYQVVGPGQTSPTAMPRFRR